MDYDPMLKYDPVPYLEQSNDPWIRYNIKRLLNMENSAEYKEMTSDTRIQALIDECVTWPEPPIRRHNDAAHSIHKIEFLTDLGLDTRDEWIKD